MSRQNIYDLELVELIENSEITDYDKSNLKYMVGSCMSHVQLSRELLIAFISLSEGYQTLQERLIYAEANRTHPKDILVVGDGKIEYLDGKDEKCIRKIKY